MPLFAQEIAPTFPADGTYTLLIPLELPGSLSLAGDAEGDIDGHHVWIRNRGSEGIEIVIHGFPSEEAAREGFASVRRWLAWSSLAFRQGLRFGKLEETVSWADTAPPDGELPNAVRGSANRGPIIYPTGQHVILGSAGIGHALIGYPAQRLLWHLAEAAAVGVADGADEDAISAGLDLYLATSWEASDYAKFLTLVNVLEALKEQPSLGTGVQRLMDAWIQELHVAEKDGDVTPVEAQSLRGSLERLRKRSISASIHALVLELLDDPEAAREAATIYRERSVLVHDGIVPEGLAERVAALEQLVPKLLRKLLAPPNKS